jgi:hypothetical protein
VECCLDPLPGSPPPAWEGNKSYSLDVPLKVLGHLSGSLVSDVMSFAEVMSEINAGRPICCHIAWAAGAQDNGHFNVIAGYVSATQALIICDPNSAYGQATVPYEIFKSNYHGGAWDQTCRTA